MAKILTTAIVADIRNKLNGSVFSKNRYGSYVRTKVTPVNPQTTSQQNARGILSSVSQGWRGLTEGQRQSWISASPNFPFTDIFGNAKILSGSALYAKLNTRLINAGASALDTAPTPVSIPTITGLSITADASTGIVTVDIDDTTVPADMALVIETTGNVPPGRYFVKNLFRKVVTKAAASTIPVTITTEFANIHGVPVEGQSIFVRAYYVSAITGQNGIAQQSMVTVGP